MDLEQRSKVVLDPEPEVTGIAIEIQRALFVAGMGRAVGVSDLQIAATAIHHTSADNVVVVARYAADFDHVAAVEPRFRSEWILPRGTVD